jgi:hypothetical protein
LDTKTRAAYSTKGHQICRVKHGQSERHLKWSKHVQKFQTAMLCWRKDHFMISSTNFKYVSHIVFSVYMCIKK